LTRAEGNVIHELGGRPPLERVQELVATLPPQDRELIGRGLHVGCVIDEYKAEPGRGDFLIRGVRGGEPRERGAGGGDTIEVGETIQFHVRDGATADEDLRTLLEREAEPAAGALLFTCNGRGSSLILRRGSRRFARFEDARPPSAGGVQLRRGDRAGRREELPARLHRIDSSAGRRLICPLEPHRGPGSLMRTCSMTSEPKPREPTL
jgi:FIST C domain